MADWRPAVATEQPIGPESGGKDATASLTVDDFFAYMPAHQYIFVPTREFWPASSVNARVKPVASMGKERITAAAWLDNHRAVEQMTWAPGEPLIIPSKLISDGGWIERPGCACFNLYRPPLDHNGVAEKATPWIDHVRRVYPLEAQHIFRWLA